MSISTTGATSKGTSQVGATQVRHRRVKKPHLGLTAQSKMCSGQQDVLQTARAIPCRRGISQKFCIWEIIGGNRSNVSGADLLTVMSARADNVYA